MRSDGNNPWPVLAFITAMVICWGLAFGLLAPTILR